MDQSIDRSIVSTISCQGNPGVHTSVPPPEGPGGPQKVTAARERRSQFTKYILYVFLMFIFFAIQKFVLSKKKPMVSTCWRKYVSEEVLGYMWGGFGV